MRENKAYLNKDEEICENIFHETTNRSADGMFILKLSLKANINELGDSYEEAKGRSLYPEQKFERNGDFKTSYISVITDNINRNHMSEVIMNDKPEFYSPHHAVVKESSETTNLRIVFDGSCRLKHGLYINDTQLVGPTIQSNLFCILATF